MQASNRAKSGSTATIFTSGILLFKYSPAPVTAPPVPAPATKISTWPTVSVQISGADSGLMDGWISRIHELAGNEAVWNLRCQLFSLSDAGLYGTRGGGIFQLGKNGGSSPSSFSMCASSSKGVLATG